MRTPAHRRPVPVRPIFSPVPDPPDVYRSVGAVGARGVFYALGTGAEMLGCECPEPDETDDEVVARLMALVDRVRQEPMLPALALVNADTIIAHGFSPSFHRPLSLPRLVR